jgi:hypothetical protein
MLPYRGAEVLTVLPAIYGGLLEPWLVTLGLAVVDRSESPFHSEDGFSRLFLMLW